VLPFILRMMATTPRVWVRLLGLATIPVVFVVTLRTDSRLAFIGFFASLLGYGVFWSFQFWRKNRESTWRPTMMLAYPSGLAAFVALSFAWRRLERLIWGGGAQQSSTDNRKEQYAMGWRILKRNPIGHGIGESATTLGYRVQDGTLTIDTYYLAVALEYGVIGFVIYYGMFLCGVFRSARVGLTTREPEIVYLVPACLALLNFLISKSVFSQQENHPIAFLLLGIIVALCWREREAQRESDWIAPTLRGPVRRTFAVRSYT
jgi:O-antigen ligase